MRESRGSSTGKIVRQDFMPELNDLPRLRESVAADVYRRKSSCRIVRQISTDVVRVLLNNKNGRCLRQTIGSRQARRSRADDENVDASTSRLFAGKWQCPRWRADRTLRRSFSPNSRNAQLWFATSVEREHRGGDGQHCFCLPGAPGLARE